MKAYSFYLIFSALITFLACSKPKDEIQDKVELIGAEVIQRDSIVEGIFNFTEVFFLDENIGFVVSASTGEVLKTDNGGKSWKSVFNDTEQFLGFLKFNEVGLGIFAAYKSGGPAWRLYLSTNEGESWSVLPDLPGDNNFIHWDWSGDSSLVFYGEDGSGSHFFHSDDLGQTWNEATYLDDRPYSEFYHISMIDRNNGIALGGFDVFKTNDGGLSWNQSLTGETWRDADFISMTHGVMIGSPGAKVTTNGTDNWDDITFKFDDQYIDILNAPFMLNEEEVFFGSSKGIFKSNNGGRSIKIINDLIDDNKFYRIDDLFMVNQDVGFAVAQERFDDTLQTTTGHRLILKTESGWE